ncbi:toxin-antitoxin system HicB family antitoxin [Anaeroselena agilis]|uniref:Toxin-antitoxin system HicB family antitoxin n=1 Tax=Anaeroselena agilis TaxID=3063788 RepID=A0ABU3P2L3_9FIRM|nr:toxin-antitoxin system HicB family antitoxin [Selenomonadales bacterium 4137-cl]
MNERRRDFAYYASLPYKIEFHPAAEGGYVASIPDLPGCITQGETSEETLRMIEDAKGAWIDAALAEGIAIPEPVPEADEYSGKFNLRIPRSLHRDLARRAEEEDVSLNTLATYLLSACMGKQLTTK